MSLVILVSDRGAAVFENLPHDGDGSASVDLGQPYDAVGIPPHRGVQSHKDRAAIPSLERLMKQGRIQTRDVNPVII